jgi:hypothetical protein
MRMPESLHCYYVPVLALKPGALRNGAPFKDWALSVPLAKLLAPAQGRTLSREGIESIRGG